MLTDLLHEHVMLASADRYVASIERSVSTRISGYVYDRLDPTAQVILELLVDGAPVALTRADLFHPDLSPEKPLGGFHGFIFTLTSGMLSSTAAQVTVANCRVVLGPPIQLRGGDLHSSEAARCAGQVEWQGGLHLTGWLRSSGQHNESMVRVEIEGETVVEVLTNRWRHVSQDGTLRAAPAFAFHLPTRFADGLTKQVVVTNGAGLPLGGSPLNLVAFPDALETLVRETYGADNGPVAARARLFDSLLPRSQPLDSLASWVKHHPLPLGPHSQDPLAVILVGDVPDDVARTLESLEAEVGLVWVAGALPSRDRIGFHPPDLLEFLRGDACRCTNLLVIQAGSRLHPGAAPRLAAALAEDPQALLAYGDIAMSHHGQVDGRLAGEGFESEIALAFPSFDYERWLEQGYGALLMALPIRVAEGLLCAGADNLYRLANASFDGAVRPREHVVHVPGIAAIVPPLDRAAATRWLSIATRQHLERRKIVAQVSPTRAALLPSVRVMRQRPSGDITVIIPTRDRADLLKSCLTSIRPGLERVGAHLVVVDNDSSDPETLALLQTVSESGGRILHKPGPFNYARLMNRAVARVSTPFVCFLNNDVEASDAYWLEELAGRLGEPSTVAVGAVLHWPSGVVQHGGIVLGPKFEASHAFCDRMGEDPGYTDLLRVASEPSALTGACLVFRRDAYVAVGGMDEVRFPINFNDVDLCLKFGAAGGAVVLSPHAILKHHESATRGRNWRPDQRGHFQRELAFLRSRWGEILMADPAYSPLLALSDIPYSALACPPRDCAPRRRFVPSVRGTPTGL